MRENFIESKLVKAVKNAGGICPKWLSPGMNGVPDRIILLPGRHIGFVEVKAPGEVPRAIQIYRHRILRSLGFSVFILDDPKDIPEIISNILKGNNQ